MFFRLWCPFLYFLLKMCKNCDIINMLNKLNISGTLGVFSCIEIYSFSLRLHIEFDKNANSSYVSVLYTFRISLLSDKSEFVFFVRRLRSAHFL